MGSVIRAFTGDKTVARWSIPSGQWSIFGVFYRSRADLALEVLLRKSGGPETETAATALQLFEPAVLGPAGAVLVWLEGRAGSRQTRHHGRLAPGRIPLVIGAGNRSGAGGDLESPQRSENWFGIWSRRTPVGALPRFTPNCKNWDSRHRNERSLVVSDALTVAATPKGVALPSFRTTGRRA
jgi:hypothetical protein